MLNRWNAVYSLPGWPVAGARPRPGTTSGPGAWSGSGSWTTPKIFKV